MLKIDFLRRMALIVSIEVYFEFAKFHLCDKNTGPL